MTKAKAASSSSSSTSKPKAPARARGATLAAKPKPPALAMPSIPSRLKDVRAWADELRLRRLNADGRAAIDLAQLALEQTLATVERAKTGPSRMRALAVGLPVVEKQLRVALQADRAEADHALVAMRRKLEQAQAAEADLDVMH